MDIQGISSLGGNYCFSVDLEVSEGFFTGSRAVGVMRCRGQRTGDCGQAPFTTAVNLPVRVPQ